MIMSLSGSGLGITRAQALWGLALLFVWVSVLRAPTFLRSAVDWDESTYVIMADQWLAGHIPYSTVWDHKPVGIYAIFALALKLFGNGIYAIRIVTILFVFGTAIMLFLVALKLFKDRLTSVLTALSYPVLTLGMEGVGSNTELFFIFFTVAGLLTLLRAREGGSGERGVYVGAGLLFGLGLQIKYVAIVEAAFLVVAAVIMVKHWPGAAGKTPRMLALSLVVAGGILPTVIVGAYFYSHHMLGEFIHTNFTVNRHYAGIYHPAQFGKFLEDWLIWILPVVYVTVIASLLPHPERGEGDASQRMTRRFLMAWVVVGILEAWSTRKFYGHYYLVTMPPLSLLLAHGLSRLGIARLPAARKFLIVAIVLALPLTIVMKDHYWPWLNEETRNGGDLPGRISSFIHDNRSEAGYIWVVNYEPVIYYLSGSRMPTRYVTPPFILEPLFNEFIGVDYAMELSSILAKRPQYVVVRESTKPRVREIEMRLHEQYAVCEVMEDVFIYKLQEPVGL